MLSNKRGFLDEKEVLSKVLLVLSISLLVFSKY